MSDQPDRLLRRDLSTQQLLFISVGSIIGSGWLFAVLSAGAVAGPAVVLSWVLAAGLVIAMALNYAETATMLPRTGGIARYPYLTHGRFFGFLMSWSLILGGITTVSVEALGVVQYAAGYVHRWWGVDLVAADGGDTRLTGAGIAGAVALMLCFFLINVVGVRFLGRLNQWITWWKVIVPVLTFVLLFVVFRGSNFTAGGGFAPRGGGAVLNAVAVSGIIFAFQGFREGVNFGGEARRPQRAILLATVFSVVLTAVIYLLLQVAFVGAINWSSMGLRPGDWSALEGSNWASQPLYSALQASGNALLGAFGSVLLVDALVSPTGAGWIYLGDGARAAYGMAAQGSLPRWFARVGARSGAPWAGLVACLVLGCLFFVPFPGWYQLIGYTSATASLTYLAAGPQVPILRRTAGDLPRPFVLRGTTVLSPLGFLAAAMVVYWAGFDVLRGVVASLFVAIPLYAAVQAPAQGRIARPAGTAVGVAFLAAWTVVQVFGPLGRNSLPFLVFWALCVAAVAAATAALLWLADPDGRREVASGGWVMALVLVLYLLSYGGSYGPSTVLPFPYDTAVAALVGVAAYFWAVRSGYDTPDLHAVRATEPAARTGLEHPEEVRT
ncbi:APC family permease [Kutzneria sp. NPDC052558]|uniref:APC family permease n=1 Tax=Kutzneria sp. NPDC052558 TaxID=3364121 RepID=UPI0037CB843C